ncbi:MAG: class I SAM-dependent methyltransferase [Clostridiales Family XIII bacterium]|nr:class I SAM-dependent methyltransferase [Clostridiales Family XIII bacterium]
MAAYVNQGDVVADIGADHAYLPILLFRQGVTRRFILTDKNEGPLIKTRESLMRAFPGTAFEPEFSLRLGDGLTPLAPGEADTVVIAGMGGETIVSILDADRAKVESVGRFIFQPRTKVETLREYINNNRYYVINEEFAPERGRMCAILVVAPKQDT